MLQEAPILDSHNFGDKKYRKNINSKELKTSVLELNIFPNRIHWNDVKKVVRIINDIISEIENKLDYNNKFVDRYIELNGKDIRLKELSNYL